ncbi:hypothetical protein TCON_1544 [Astathelohania contejeani]|uniref:Uncharacterized protein n=1 Tax=Astathelohania contejeani TaxID=164912 RepID=A0ABQ7HYM1_9MICR|nr:hypothetical protein TCON_1544 [Thelohania contejeani]
MLFLLLTYLLSILCTSSKNDSIETCENAIEDLINTSDKLYKTVIEVKEKSEIILVCILNQIIKKEITTQHIIFDFIRPIDIIKISKIILKKTKDALLPFKAIIDKMLIVINYLNDILLLKECQILKKDIDFILNYIAGIENFYNFVFDLRDINMSEINLMNDFSELETITKALPTFSIENCNIIWEKCQNLHDNSLSLAKKWYALTQEEKKDISSGCDLSINDFIKYEIIDFFDSFIILNNLYEYFFKLSKLSKEELYIFRNNKYDIINLMNSITKFESCYEEFKLKNDEYFKSINNNMRMNINNENEIIERNYLRFIKICRKCDMITEDYISTLEILIFDDKVYYKKEIESLFEFVYDCFSKYSQHLNNEMVNKIRDADKKIKLIIHAFYLTPNNENEKYNNIKKNFDDLVGISAILTSVFSNEHMLKKRYSHILFKDSDQLRDINEESYITSLFSIFNKEIETIIEISDACEEYIIHEDEENEHACQSIDEHLIKKSLELLVELIVDKNI